MAESRCTAAKAGSYTKNKDINMKHHSPKLSHVYKCRPQPSGLHCTTASLACDNNQTDAMNLISQGPMQHKT
jgi:hypothetical protein